MPLSPGHSPDPHSTKVLVKDRKPPAAESDGADLELPSPRTFHFADKHNPRVPADYWFQQTTEGPAFFVVFYTQACRWARCLACNLPSKSSPKHVEFSDIMKQVDFVFDYLLLDQQKKDLAKIIVSNNGSVLDQDTFSTTALLYLIAKLNLNCPNLKVLTIETRPEYVDLAELDVVARAIKEGKSPTRLEVAIGMEVFDTAIRNEHFRKGLKLDKFENMVAKIAAFGFDLKVYLMQKPVPSMTEEQAIEDVKAAIRYLDEVGRRHNVKINMHLNPTYVCEGTDLEKAFRKGEYQPPRLESVRQAVLSAEGTSLSVYIGLYDEGLAIPGGGFVREGDETLLRTMELFNVSQDYQLLKTPVQ